MQSALRALNIIASPALTLSFASRLEGLTIAGQDAGEIVGGAGAGLLVLAIEIALTQGPKHSVWLRQWLDARAVFEGFWLQDVFAGPGGNRVGLFSMDYQREEDSYAARGHAYSAHGRRWAKWNSTHIFIDKARLKATYVWEGELLDGQTPEPEKSGLTDLELPRAPAFSLPMTGEGRVGHVGEGTRLKFLLRRVTNQLLHELGLTFTVRELRINAYDEQGKLVQSFLRHRDRYSADIAPS